MFPVTSQTEIRYVPEIERKSEESLRLERVSSTKCRMANLCKGKPSETREFDSMSRLDPCKRHHARERGGVFAANTMELGWNSAIRSIRSRCRQLTRVARFRVQS